MRDTPSGSPCGSNSRWRAVHHSLTDVAKSTTARERLSLSLQEQNTIFLLALYATESPQNFIHMINKVMMMVMINC